MFQEIMQFLENFGPLGLFIHAFIDAIIFPLPAFFLQVSLSLLNPSTALWLATVGYIGCLLGTPIGYFLGKFMGKSVLYRFLKKKWIDAATEKFQKSGETAILIGSFTPIPFKVFTILSGCLNFPLWRLIAYAAIGRGLKFYIVGLLFYFYGRAAENMVSDVSLYIFIGAVPLIAIYLWVRKRRIKKQELAALAAEAAAAAGTAEIDESVLTVETDGSVISDESLGSDAKAVSTESSKPKKHVKDKSSTQASM